MSALPDTKPTRYDMERNPGGDKAGVVRRTDKYNIAIDGVQFVATSEQEDRIRGLSVAERQRLRQIMGGGGR